MSSDRNDRAKRDSQLDEAIAAYLLAVEAGESPDRQKWLERYPQFAKELADFFAAQDQFDAVAKHSGLPSTGPFVPPTVDYVAGALSDTAVDPLRLRPAKALRQPISPGTVLAGKYRVFDVKSGGMGVVFLADDLPAREKDIELKVAIKTVRDYEDWKGERGKKGADASESGYTSLLARFHREAMSWVRLGWHDNIILAIEVINIGNKPYLVMQYADSGDLASWIREGRMTVALAVSFAVQFCRGMRHAIDTVGLIHRDIKPANILIKDDRILKISDFGLSKAFNSADGQTLDGPSSSDGMLSRAGAGTRPYMAPEQFVSLGQADTRSDIFSFGATLYEMLTSRRLFGEMTAYDRAILGKPPESARQTNRAVPQRLSDVVDRCVAYDPNRRYQHFSELEADLVELHGHLPYRIPIPEDSQRPLPAFFGPSCKALGETYALISLGRPGDAIRKAQEGIDCDPNNAEHWINKGKALGDLQFFAESRDCFERAVGLAPWNAIAWSNLGWAHLAMDDVEEGLKHADHAVSLDGTFADAWSCRAACARSLGQVEKALASFQQATVLAPENWVAYFNLGCLLADLGRHDEALSAFHAAARINPNSATAWYKIAFSLASQNKIVAALPAIDRSLELDPRDAEAWAFRGILLWQGEGQVEAARHCIDKALALDSANQQARTVQAALQQLREMSGVFDE